jgi:predicted RNA-binding Zn ribbon-like protein
LHGYPGTWLEHRGQGEATDLDLVVLLLNSHDLLEDPSDRLTNLDWFRAVLADVGHEDIAESLQPPDLVGLRQLREGLRAVFKAASSEEAATILNPMLREAPAVPQLVVGADGIWLRVSPGELGLRALAARLPAALAGHVAEHGLVRLGSCAAGPCRCAFIDYTRGRTRKYCCTQCNDRASARLYRERKREA